MARQVLHGHIKLEELFYSRIQQIEPGVSELALGCVIRVLPLPGSDQTRKPPDCFFIEAHRLAHFARRRTAAIGDDVCGHRRPVCAVALIDVLNDTLTLIATG